MKSTLTLALLLSLLTLAQAPASPVNILPYEKLYATSDLVVIATPTAVRGARESAVFPGIQRNEQPVPAVSMEADFQILVELKGLHEGKTFVLHYLRDPDQSGVLINGPFLVSFDPAKKMRYLLFLKREADGRYAPANGQLDPVYSIKDLGPLP